MQIHSIADIVGDSATHALAAAGTPARWITIGALGGAIRLGDSNAAVARGANIAQNGSFTLPADPDITARYDLSLVYVFVPSGATASISYGL